LDVGGGRRGAWSAVGNYAAGNSSDVKKKVRSYSIYKLQVLLPSNVLIRFDNITFSFISYYFSNAFI
jgi:hypothetical protein